MEKNRFFYPRTRGLKKRTPHYKLKMKIILGGLARYREHTTATYD